MIEKIIDFSLKYKLIIIFFTLTVAGFGIYAVMNIPVGAVPDITNNQVQVITTSGNLSTQEIEQFITAPVELEMANLPGVKEIRSVSKFGLSVVTIVFDEKMGTYLPRQLIAEKIKSASQNIPEGFGTPEMGPITTGLGEIYQYILDVKPGYENRYSPMEMRTIQDWIVRRQLSGISGVVEVNSWGGYLKQYEVAIHPDRLTAMGISLMDVYKAMENNNSISGGGYIEKNAESYFIRGDAQVKSLEDIQKIVISNKNGIPVLIGDVAEVRFGYANRYGAITANGEGEKVLGQIMMLKNANSKKVINEVHDRVEKVQKNLPEGVYINPILERSTLIQKTSFTVFENLIFGCIIVFLVVLLLLGNLRSALVIASMIPLALLFTLSMMYVFGIDANLMSLGALDFGIIIDGAVIIVEFAAVQMLVHKKNINKLDKSQKQKYIDEVTYKSSVNMMNSAIFGQLIILIVFIPILSLTGVEGKMFRPMALAFSFAIIGAMIFCLTWLPVAISLFLKPKENSPNNISEVIMRFAKRTYQPSLKWSLNHRFTVLGIALASLILSLVLFFNMGGEFVPTLDEGDFVIQPVLKTGTSLSKTVELTTQMEKILKDKFPEVSQIVCRIGAAEVPTDPMSMEEIDMIITLKPKKEWKTAKTKEGLAEKFKEALSVIPGIDYEFTQPIEMRFNELITGVRSDIAVKVFGEDLDYLNKKAIEIKKIIDNIPGAADVILEKTAGLPQMNVTYNRDKIAFYGVEPATLNTFLSSAFGGNIAGSVFEGEKRFDMVVRLDKDNRSDIENIRQLQVPLANGHQIPLSELADISYTEGPAKISRENTHRRVVVSVNVRNRDLQSVVKDIQDKVDKNIQLIPGTYIEYGGQFENMQNATKHLAFAVPISLALIFIFLHFAFKSMTDTIMIFSAVPLSVVGGIFALWLRGMPFSISAGVGFIALFGIAVLNGIVLIEHLKELKGGEDTNLKDMVLHGANDRLRPVILTAASAAMGFFPMAVSNGAGAEVQKPLATVVIGGLVTSTILTMIILPILFTLFDGKKITMKRRKKKTIIPPTLTIILLLLFLSPIFVQAQKTELSLENALDIALKNNKSYGASQLRAEERRALVSAFMDIEKTNVYYEYDEANVSENGHPLRTFGVEQKIEFPTIYVNRKKSENLLASIAEAEVTKQRQLLIKKVASTYFTLQFLQAKENNLYKIDSLYQIVNANVEKRYSLGDVSALDKMNANAKKQQSAMQLSQTRYDIQNAYLQLQSLMQSNMEFTVPMHTFQIIPVIKSELMDNPEIRINDLQKQYLSSSLKLAQQKLLPDITLGYFFANNNYEQKRTYQGFKVGVGIPLFFTDMSAKIRAGKIAITVNEYERQNNVVTLQTKQSMLLNDIQKHREAIENFEQNGQKLNEEIMRSATKSYQAGQIDFYQYVMSMENAQNIIIDFYQSILNYNNTALEINYLEK